MRAAARHVPRCQPAPVHRGLGLGALPKLVAAPGRQRSLVHHRQSVLQRGERETCQTLLADVTPCRKMLRSHQQRRQRQQALTAVPLAAACTPNASSCATRAGATSCSGPRTPN